LALSVWQVAGAESHLFISLEERRILAHHEAGHAVVAWFLQHAPPLVKVRQTTTGRLDRLFYHRPLADLDRPWLPLCGPRVVSCQVTILPRSSGALGFAQYKVGGGVKRKALSHPPGRLMMMDPTLQLSQEHASHRLLGRFL
jgi:hypothetical protein